MEHRSVEKRRRHVLVPESVVRVQYNPRNATEEGTKGARRPPPLTEKLRRALHRVTCAVNDTPRLSDAARMRNESQRTVRETRDRLTASVKHDRASVNSTIDPIRFAFT